MTNQLLLDGSRHNVVLRPVQVHKILQHDNFAVLWYLSRRLSLNSHLQFRKMPMIRFLDDVHNGKVRQCLK